MARFEILDSTTAPLGEGPAAGDVLFELGMMYSVGRDVPIDLVSAHKWFNLAAVKGNREAVRLRREIADQMSESRNRRGAACRPRLAQSQRPGGTSGGARRLTFVRKTPRAAKIGKPRERNGAPAAFVSVVLLQRSG